KWFQGPEAAGPHSCGMRKVFACAMLAAGAVAAIECCAGSAATLAATLLGEVRAAAGGDAWNGIASIVSRGTERSSGSSGIWRSVEDVGSGRIRRSGEAGLNRYLLVWNGPNRWQQDLSGGVHP